MALYETLDRLEFIYYRLERATLLDAVPDPLEIIFLRQQFARAYDDFAAALQADEMMQGQPALAASLRDELGTMRIRLMSYTMQWQPAQIEAEPEAYRKAAQVIADLVWDFIGSTRDRLAKAGIRS